MVEEFTVSKQEKIGVAVEHPYADLRQATLPDSCADQAVALTGSLCADCGHKMYGRALVCTHCLSSRIETFDLNPAGKLYAFTRVHASKSLPTPYNLGYVDLLDGVRVLAIIAADFNDLRSDQAVYIAQVTADHITCKLAV